MCSECFHHQSHTKGYVYKYDISLAASDFDSFIHDMKVRLIDQQKAASSDENLICGNWGHIIGKNWAKNEKKKWKYYKHNLL